jgi:predicted MFS family arabinose efflux permease
MSTYTATATSEPVAKQLSSAMLWLLSLTCGMLIANVYFGQPLTGLISASLGMPPQSAGLIVTLPLIGYGAGLLLLVPLGDMIENRRLILLLVSIEAACLLLIAALPHPFAFLVTAFFMGMAGSVVQVVQPYVSHLMPETSRGEAIGRLVSGVMLGIMLARPLSSFVAYFGSWRSIYVLSGAATIVLGFVLRQFMPVRQPAAGPRYVALMGSMGGLFIHTEVLRRRAFYHAAMFGTFSVFWTAVPLWLSGSPFNLTQNGIAWVALAGVAGAVAPPFAGRLADKGGARAGTALAMLLAALAFLLTNVGWSGGKWGLGMVVVAAILLDFAVSANLVFGQRAIYALGPERRSRLNGLYMAIFFAGGAIGSAIGGWSFARFGWSGVSVVGVTLPLLALLYWATEFSAPRGQEHEQPASSS